MAGQIVYFLDFNENPMVNDGPCFTHFDQRRISLATGCDFMELLPKRAASPDEKDLADRYKF